MSQRPWTAILSSSGHFTAINITAALETDKAKMEIEEKNPGRELVALIPGTHAAGSHTFCAEDANKLRRVSWINPFDTATIGTE